MNDKTPNSRSLNDPARCQHRTATGKRCRLRVVDASAGLCFQHASRSSQHLDSADLSATLTKDSAEFQTAQGINHSLSDLYVLLAQNRISSRRAAVLAYIGSLLLRTLPAMDAELGQDAGPIIINDLPRPCRDPLAEPS